MAAIPAPLTADQPFDRKGAPLQRGFKVKGGAMIYAGATVAIDPNTGLAYPAGAAATDKVVGVAEQFANNVAGADGAMWTGPLWSGAGSLVSRNNAAGDPVDASCIDKVVYAPDDNSVSKTNNGGAFAPAGILRMIGGDGTVFIEFGYITH
jgi:hypothetical protein